MGLNLGFIGKKLQDYEGDVGRFFGGAAQGVGQAAHTLGNVANATSQAVGGSVNYGITHPLEVAKATPVLGDAIKFGQLSATPQFQQQSLGQQVGQFAGGIAHEGFDPLIRTGGRIAATLTNHPQVSLAGRSLPVSQEIGQAQPIAGNKLLGQAATGLGIIGDATAYAGGLHLPTEGVRLPGPSIVNRAQVALKKVGQNAQDTLGQEQGGVAIMHPWDQRQETINQTQDQIANLKADISARQLAAQEAHRQIDANPMIKSTAKDAMHRTAEELAARDVRLKQEELAGWMDHLNRLAPEAKPATSAAQLTDGVPATQPMSYDPVPTTTQKMVAHLKQTLTGEAGQRGSHNMFEPVNAPGGTPKPETLNHYTTPEAAKVLSEGGKFDHTKAPVHGARSGSGASDFAGRIVSDNGPAIYLSRDDKAWGTASKPTGEPINIDHVTPEQMAAGYFEKNGVTPVFDYKTQKYVGVKSETTPLVAVPHHIDPGARQLTIDSQAKLKQLSDTMGATPDMPAFWSKLRQQYDVVNLSNVKEAGQGEGTLAKFFRGAKADQAIVLNPDKVSTKASTAPSLAVESKPKVGKKQPPKDMTAAEFLSVDPKAPTTAEAHAASTPPLTVEKVATAAARAKEVAQADAQKGIDRVQSAQFNPVKIKTAEVKPGDYPQAIARAAQLSQPVDVARSQWESSMRRLQKESPNEYKNFWNAVETPGDAGHSVLLKEAIARWRAGADRAHAGSVVLGKNVGYMQDYARHPWDLSGWKEAEGATGGTPFTTKERIHRTIAEGEAAGLKQKGDPLGEGRAYFKAAQSTLHKDALIHGLEKADAGQTIKPHTLDLGYGKTVQLSDEGHAAARGTAFSTGSKNPVVRGVRQTQGVIKGTLLSLSQFHPINIAVLRAAPALVAKGHFAEAAKGIYGTFRGAFGNDYAEHVIGQALKDGTVEKAAQIGMPFGSSEYHGFNMKRGIGEQTVFNKQMPMMHNQVVRSIIDDLDKRGIPLDSPEARAAGKAGNNMMGFVNDEMQRISPRTRQAMSDWLLAGQFTPAKFGNLRDSFRGGQGGSYARAAVAGNVAALTALSLGLGWVAKQKSDNIKDLFLRSLVDPAVPTSMQDGRGNTIKLRLPGSNVSDIAKLAGVTLTRGKDGHLGVNWSPSNMPSTVEDWMRARLGPLASAAVKLKTNNTFGGKPLYDPNAKTSTQAQQAATSLVVGDLPIGTQGLAYTDTVKNHTPKDIKAVLDAQTPGTNPVLKSLGASFGLTPATDTTVGKGRDNAAYFGALDQAKKGLNRQAQDALDLYTGSKKNPVTGAYDVQPNVNDQKARASALLQNPDALGHLVSMNKALSDQGQKVDPLWTASPDQITKYLQYQTMRPNGPDQQNWRATNTWYADLQKSRSTFFDSLPPGDPNKPTAPIEYPQASAPVQAKLDTYFSLPVGKQRAVFIDQNPDVAAQFKAQTDYYTKLSTAQGYAKTKDYPEASPQIKQALDAGNYAAPGVRDYLAKISEYNVIKGGTAAQFAGTDLSQSALKGIYSLGNYDISKTPQSDGTNKYALDTNASQSKNASFSHPYRPNPTRHAQIGKGKRLKGGSRKVSLRGIKKISVKRKLV